MFSIWDGSLNNTYISLTRRVPMYHTIRITHNRAQRNGREKERDKCRSSRAHTYWTPCSAPESRTRQHSSIFEMSFSLAFFLFSSRLLSALIPFRTCACVTLYKSRANVTTDEQYYRTNSYSHSTAACAVSVVAAVVVVVSASCKKRVLVESEESAADDGTGENVYLI